MPVSVPSNPQAARRLSVLTVLLLGLVLVCYDQLAETHDLGLVFSLMASFKALPFPVQAFWHLGDTGSSSFDIIVQEQYARLQRSGLLNHTTVAATYLGLDYTTMPHFDHPRIAMEYGGPASLAEFPTLRKLQTYCAATPKARVLYFHTKGKLFPLSMPCTRPLLSLLIPHAPRSGAGYGLEHEQYNRSREWRLMMEHFILDLHLPLLQHELGLGSPYVTVGTQYRPFTRTRGRNWAMFPAHYSGNFWMAKCTFINTLERIDTLHLEDRYEAEFWLSSGPDFEAHHKDCWNMQEDECEPPGTDLYTCMLKRSAYEAARGCRGPSAELSHFVWARSWWAGFAQLMHDLWHGSAS